MFTVYWGATKICVEWNTCSWLLLPAPLCPEVVVLVRVPSMDQIDLFKNYLYLIGASEKKNLKKQIHKNINIYVQ